MIFFLPAYFACHSSCFFLSYFSPWYWISGSRMLSLLKWLLEQLGPALAEYFDYQEIHETTPRDVWTEVKEGKSNFLIVKQPHGAISFTGMYVLYRHYRRVEKTVACTYKGGRLSRTFDVVGFLFVVGILFCVCESMPTNPKPSTGFRRVWHPPKFAALSKRPWPMPSW